MASCQRRSWISAIAGRQIMNDVIAGFLVSLGFAVDKSSQQTATRSVADYEKAVRDAEKAIEDARWHGAKTQEEIAKLTVS